jgi:ABC-2 type transport system permease protein
MFISPNFITPNKMFTGLFKFDWLFFTRKIYFYAVLISFAALGLLTAAAASFPFPDTFKNSPYVITYITGIMSLLCIFSVTLLAAQSMLREKDSQFDLILYATPINKRSYLTSRMAVILLVATLSFALYMVGLLLGHQLFRRYADQYTHVRFWYYIQPFLVLAVPNILLCTGVICSIGAIAKNKMVIYISGLFIYFLYWGVSLFSNSPLMANASPVSPQSMQLMARLDPFGMSAFFEQTQYWSAAQRNSQVLALQGNFLFNRALFICIAGMFILFAYYKFSFTLLGSKKNSRKQPQADSPIPGIAYKAIHTHTRGLRYHLRIWYSYVKLDIGFVIKGIPFWLLILGWDCFFSMELYGDIAGGSRFPEKFATSALMVTNILEMLPTIGLLAVIFYGSEIFWRSQSARFYGIENSSPAPQSVVLLAKWFALSAVPLLVIASNVIIGIFFQLAFGYADIDWGLYLSLFYLIGLPLSLSAAFVSAFQIFCNNRYKGLAVSAVLLLVTNTSLGGLVGLKNPLLRYANVYQGLYSEMNGFDLFLKAFHIKMLYWFFVAGVIFLIGIRVWDRYKKWYALTLLPTVLLSFCIAGALISGYVISSQTIIKSKDERNNWKQAYEERYKKWSNQPQPTIVAVKTNIDLYPETNSYTVNGIYTLVNKSSRPIDSLLLYTDKDLQWQAVQIKEARQLSKDATYGHAWYALKSPLKPGDSTVMKFSFSYRVSAFNGFTQFNAILRNGSFIRISSFFPRFGYMGDNEIEDSTERHNRKMPASNIVKPLEVNADNPYNYGYIILDATISTSKNQTVIGVGELRAKWHTANRNYFRYQTLKPIPFRFAVASAQYAVQRLKHRAISVEAYCQPGHQQNIARLLNDAKKTLDYCEQNFGKYPYRTVRFAEISSFTKGFAATAYPTDFFINEDFGFQNKIESDPHRDILNEQVSHELSHTWWGNALIDPEYQQGSKVLTETLAMYTELMLYKKEYGVENILSRVELHKEIYLAERGFAGEEPLYISDPEKTFLCYDKGMVVMYQMYLLLGEAKINQALKSFLNKYTYPHQPPTTLSLLNEFYTVSNKAQHAKIDELFKQIITYDLQLNKVVLSTENGRYGLTIDIVVKKHKEDGQGNKVMLPFDEPVEIDVEFENGRKQTIEFNHLPNNKFLSFRQKPISITVDPRMRYLDLNAENNVKKIK